MGSSPVVVVNWTACSCFILFECSFHGNIKASFHRKLLFQPEALYLYTFVCQIFSDNISMELSFFSCVSFFKLFSWNSLSCLSKFTYSEKQMKNWHPNYFLILQLNKIKLWKSQALFYNTPLLFRIYLSPITCCRISVFKV